MKLAIKNMVCSRCIRVIKEELQKLGITVNHIELGIADVDFDDTKISLKDIDQVLKENGFELLENTTSKLIERIKNSITEFIYNGYMEESDINISDYLKQKIKKDYSYISSLFSSTQHLTIEQYFIRQKIERIKELIIYDELSLSEIAYKLGYSSAQHLSTQFKKITGLTPGYYRKIKEKKRTPIDKI